MENDKCNEIGLIHRETTVREISLVLLLIMLFGSFIFTAYKLWWPINPIEIKGLEISSYDVKRGETVYFTFVGQKLMDISPYITIELVNGERMQIMSYVSNTPVGYVFKKRSFIVPYHIQPGRYRLVWTAVYSINGLRNITKTTQSEFITIR